MTRASKPIQSRRGVRWTERHHVMDKRTADRLPIALPLTYVMETSKGSFQGRAATLNISGTGVQFAVPALVPPETRCRLGLSLPQHARSLSFPARVIWCKPRQGRRRGEFEVGVTIATTKTSRQEDFADYCRFIASQLLKRHLR